MVNNQITRSLKNSFEYMENLPEIEALELESMEKDLFYIEDRSFLRHIPRRRRFKYVFMKIRIFTNNKLNKQIFNTREIYKIYHNLRKNRKIEFRKLCIYQMIITAMLIHFVGNNKKIVVKGNKAKYGETTIEYTSPIRVK